MQNVEPRHALEPRKHVGADIAKWMTNMEPSTRGVGEHVENKELFAARDLFGFS